MYSKHIDRGVVCDSNLRIPVTLVKHTPIHDSCDLNGYRVVSGKPSCGNKWHFQKSLPTSSWCKIDTCVIEGGKC